MFTTATTHKSNEFGQRLSCFRKKSIRTEEENSGREEEGMDHKVKRSRAASQEERQLSLLCRGWEVGWRNDPREALRHTRAGGAYQMVTARCPKRLDQVSL